MAVRKIACVQAAFKKLNFLDKVYFCNYPPPEVSDKINRWISNHQDRYTHLIISSDDITPSPQNIRQLIEDVTIYDLPCVGGWCNICYFTRQDVNGMICGDCVDDQPHEDTNVTFEPVDTVQLCRKSYNFVKVAWARDHPTIYPVWFQGMACGCVAIETWKRVKFRSLMDGVGGLMQDLAFAIDISNLGISQFVDFRVGMRHYGTHHGQLLVGKEPRKIRFEKAKHH